MGPGGASALQVNASTRMQHSYPWLEVDVGKGREM